jgi:LVIVD repeat-containing protein
VRLRTLLVLLALGVIALAPVASRSALGPTDVAGVPAAQVGVHGPTADFASGPLELVGHADMTPPGGTTPLGNNGGVALIGDCAYVGRWHDYSGKNKIQIVDVSDPTSPGVVGGLPGSAVPDAVAREIRAIDLPGFKMLTVMTFSKYLDAGLLVAGQNALRFYTFPSGDCTKPRLAGTFSLRPFRPHEFFQWIDPDPAHNVDGHPRVVEFITTPLNGTDVIVVDASRPANARLIGLYNAGIPLASHTEANVDPSLPVGLGNYSHSISLSPDGKRAFVSHWDGGYFTVDTSLFAAALPAGAILPAGLASVPLDYQPDWVGNTHSAVAVPGSNTIVTGDEVYVTTDGCPFGWLHTLDAGSLTAPPSRLGEFTLAENRRTSCASNGLVKQRNALGQRLDGTFSMHNQTVTSRYVVTSWYGGGVRVIDVVDPRHPSQVAFFVPEPLPQISSPPDTPAPVYGKTGSQTDDWWVATWSYPIIRNGLIYVADMRNGLYILRATPGSDLAHDLDGFDFLEGNSNLGDFR